ncbi:gluconokinase, GntK/IdnK-type [uncultured Erythrobacter sp.]|uniref:gluconokinase n=1 Tax=uncultured Erythrobacter sp. TaxID=263913 RepID=UPI0026322F47|nr:gluconokinase, GntK/IdnK-type [uncultured Erythrobacter sp.]
MPRQLIVVMGPSGCGKSSVSAALAETIGAPMLEGDDFHSDKNRAKMASGHPLTDSDRAGWLDAIWHALETHLAPRVLLACSALTPYVQSRLREASNRDIRFVLLDVPRDVLAERLERRTDHFMPPTLLDSQIEALKVPQDAIVIDASQSVDAIVAEVVSQLEN